MQENQSNLKNMTEEAQTYQTAAKSGKVKWLKTRNAMTHLTPKKKKRK